MVGSRVSAARKTRSDQTLDKPIEQFLAALPRPADVLRRTSGMTFGEQTKYISWYIPGSFKTIEILQLTDVQFGHTACRYDRVVEYRDWVLSEPNRFMVWTGDMVDAWAMWSPGRGFEQIGDPQSQVLRFCEVWAPARHRILSYVGGNHERRAIPGFGDLGILLAALLQIPYSNGRQLVDIYYGKHRPFTITQWHGRGGARTKGTVAQVLHRFASEGDSQWYCMGHLHQALVMPFFKERRAVSQKIKLQKCIASIGTSFMEHWNTYGEVSGYSGHDVIMPMVVLEPSGRWECRLR